MPQRTGREPVRSSLARSTQASVSRWCRDACCCSSSQVLPKCMLAPSWRRGDWTRSPTLSAPIRPHGHARRQLRAAAPPHVRSESQRACGIPVVACGIPVEGCCC